MRLLPFVASVAFFAASGSAFAADCTKGMLWPYTRNPGDCLTDAEIKAGKTGVYSGPVNTNVDVSNIKPDTSTLSTPSSGGGSTGGYFSGGLIGELTGGSSSTPSSNAVACNKGYLWPFLREPGDCLTATEKLTDKTGVYRGGEVTQASASNAPADNAGATSNPPSASPSLPPASSPAACQKSWLWPFVRETGDCSTEVERQTNKNGVYRSGEVTRVSATPAPAGDAAAAKPPANVPSPPASSASACQKSLFWPFVRESGDCPTDTDRQTNKNGVDRGGEVTQVSASTAPAGDTGTDNPPAKAVPQPASSTPGCQKSLLWPFVRKAGDCPTDADKK